MQQLGIANKNKLQQHYSMLLRRKAYSLQLDACKTVESYETSIFEQYEGIFGCVLNTTEYIYQFHTQLFIQEHL